jgi:solute:Na+ symporter, SSS family
MFVPAVVVLPGLVGLAVIPAQVKEQYNMVVPLLIQRYYPSGLLGIGLTALLASFMSGMAGNVTAFNTVWTFDIYQAYVRPGQSEQHYVRMGRLVTVVGTILSVATSYLAMPFNNMGDYLILIFALFIFFMSTAFLLGMFWKRTTASGAFYGMVTGVGANLVHYALIYAGIIHYRTDMAANSAIVIVGWLLGFAVAIGVSLVTESRPESELYGLVYSRSHPLRSVPTRWYQKPALWGIAILAMLGFIASAFW